MVALIIEGFIAVEIGVPYIFQRKPCHSISVPCSHLHYIFCTLASHLDANKKAHEFLS